LVGLKKFDLQQLSAFLNVGVELVSSNFS